MQDEIIIRHRQRLKHHFVNTSKVLLYGYRNLADAAKITYQVIDGFDWEDKATGESKGYAFPAAETIAEIRGISVRTVQPFGLTERLSQTKSASNEARL